MRSGLKVKVRFDTVPDVTLSLIDMSMPSPGSCHCRVGMAWRYSSTVAMQVSWFCVPAVMTETGRIDTLGGCKATYKMREREGELVSS